MADDRSYRVLIRYDDDDDTFTAYVPELELAATADTRAEAVTLVEDAIEARVHKAAEGDEMPPPVDAQTYEGELTLRLSQSLRRDLEYHANRSEMSVEKLANEVLARGIGFLDGKVGARMRAPEQEDDRGNRSGRPQGRGRGRNRREGYRPDMDDSANWMEYVRNLEKGGGGGGGRGGGGRGRR